MLVAFWVPASLGQAPAPAENAATKQPKPDGDRLFRTHDKLPVEISAEFRAIGRDSSAEPEDREAALTFPHDGATRTVTIGVRARGKSRRDKNVCRFPPLRLNFRTKEMKGTTFAKQDKLKLVTHCSALGNNSRSNQRYLQLEYLVYRMLNELTNQSFRVRPVSVTYVSTDRGNRRDVHPAFLIESKERLGKRLGLELSTLPRIRLAQLDPVSATRTELFQYLIGNTDYSILQGPKGDRCCHNTVLYELGERFLPVPYDFDATGFVDPPYAMPAENLRLQNVRKRLFRGFCRDDAIIAAARSEFLHARVALEALISSHELLDESGTRAALSYLEKFFEVFEDDARFRKEITGKCRGGQRSNS